jgi:tetratricopeptide (TPR) repeat protein
MSKLLVDLEKAIASESNQARSGTLRVRRSVYLSRVGRFSEAEADIQSLRTDFDGGQSPSVSIWIMFAEGILYTFRDLSDQGADRVMRSLALANATRERPLISLASAWRAHHQFERSEFRGMIRSIESALNNSEKDDHDSLARVYSVLGNAYMSSGQRARGTACYSVCHHHALLAGDQATIDANIYNKAAFAAAWLRARACFGESDSNWVTVVKGELRSSQNYQTLAGMTAVTGLVALASARMSVLSGDYVAAIPALGAARQMKPFSAYGFHQSLIDLELAYCHMKLNDEELARSHFQVGTQSDYSSLHSDEQLVAAWINATVLQQFPDAGDYKAAQLALDERKSGFDKEKMEIEAALVELGDTPFANLPAGVRSPTEVSK